MIPKYKTIYPENFEAELNFDFIHILWVKDKSNKQLLYSILPEDFKSAGIDYFRNNWRRFMLRINKIYLSNYPDNKNPKRLLIKYIKP